MAHYTSPDGIQYTHSRGYLIYGLCCPDTGRCRYVGRSMYGLGRPRQHWGTKKHREQPDHTHTWIRQLLRRKRRPVIVVLEVLRPGPDVCHRLDMAERRWIYAMLQAGEPLTNQMTPDTPTSAITRRGWHHSRITRRKISAAKVGRKRPPSFKALMRRTVQHHSRPVIDTTTGQWFPSVRSVRRRFGLSNCMIYRILKGQAKPTSRSTKGHWFVLDTTHVPPERSRRHGVRRR